MVARINNGKSIKGVLNYNETKVKEGVAQCIDAVGFGCSPDELSFTNKLTRFTDLTARNKIAKTNAVHISLNFHPDENLNEQTLREIAATYMEKIGFGDQPYLVYRHFDAAHDHIHIATVNIRPNGRRIDTHNTGKNESNQARKEIEDLFGLFKSGNSDNKFTAGLKPADLSKAEYGKRPTKNEISNIVRTVAKYYRYGNFKEYSGILEEYNVLANRGEPGSRMYEAGGLVYQLLDRKTGKGVGVPIKSSSIYEEPMLKKIEARYEKNIEIRKNYRQRMRRTIDNALAGATDRHSFIALLKAENIIADFKINDEGFTYGITFIDKTTFCFFNGSDVAKGYGAKAILERLQTGSPKQNAFNRDFVDKLLAETDFSKDFKAVLTDWMRSGALVKAFDTEDGSIRYKIGHVTTEPTSFLPANEQMNSYFQANRLDIHQANTIVDFVFTHLFPIGKFHPTTDEWVALLPKLEKEFTSLLHLLWEPTYGSAAQPLALLREARKKKRRRRN
ncbi:MAG: relaxase/mobilization nuclease domain-containing protein [Chitinophagaceae bacterium]|nr:relaxase/mobilization nuclease domain-containing protein [Chitinophagaceae bacterium]